MKNYITPLYVFTPGFSGFGTIQTNITNFDIKLLVGIINVTRGTVIYWPASSGKGFTNISGDTITLEADTSSHNSADILQIVYDGTADYPIFIRDKVMNTAVGAPDDSAASSDTGAFGIIAFIKRAMQNWTTLLGRVPASVGGRVPVDGSGVTQPVSGPLTDAQLRATVVPVSVSNFPATQPVSGPLTDAQLRATAVPVSGPLTDAQLRASAVPVSGPLTNAQLSVSEVTETLRQIQMEVEVLKNSIGQIRVDSGGRLRILLDSISASLTLATVTTVGTVSTVTNQTQIGGVNANDQVPALRRLQADSLLSKIIIS